MIAARRLWVRRLRRNHEMMKLGRDDLALLRTARDALALLAQRQRRRLREQPLIRLCCRDK